MVMKIYTKTGDTGETGLIGGKRVSKDHVRVDAYGEVDELNSVVGLARAESEAGDAFDLALERIQCLLFELGSELATPQKDRQLSSGIQPEDTAWLESEMDKAEEELEPLKSFILPGGSRLSSYLHLARSVCRRAERRCVELRHQEPDIEDIALIWLNRLSDYFFVMSRLANQRQGIPDVAWKARPKA
ncbi:MAG: cob(I)yrinic acid a,c-diamide adenosyltransferase [Myxococcota bacterium]|nr:cob(I)yrinic acid a,c-diamide adenosyltransferase [Myxococcota bacterium]